MSTAPTIRVATVDTQAIFRAGIRHICAAFPDIEVVAEADRCSDALPLCERFRPSLMLLDGTLPDALSLLAQLRHDDYGVAVVILVDQVDGALLRRALQLGVAGYLLKQINAFDLIQAIRSAAGGFLTLAPEVAAVALGKENPTMFDQDTLSDREQAVLALLLHGMSNNAIATRLQISTSTVKFHLRNIYDKLGVHSRAEALAVIYGQKHVAAQHSDEVLNLRQRMLAIAV